MPDGPPLLECRALAGGYRDASGAPRILFEDVSLSVYPGDVLVVLGRSGSGKSTLLRLLNRFSEPLSGAVLHRGTPIDDVEPTELRRKVGLVLQTPVVFEGTGAANLKTRPRGAARPSDEDMLAGLRRVDLPREVLEQPAAELSVGQQQRVCLLRAVLADPDVLLLDEPTAALDPHTVGIVAGLLTHLASTRAIGAIVVTHDRNLVERLPARIALLDTGVFTLDPAPDEVQRFLSGSSADGSNSTVSGEPPSLASVGSVQRRHEP